jgi:hypothetical protein
MSTPVLLRWIGSILLLVGYMILLWGDINTALILRICGGLSLLPFGLKLKLWDLIGLQAFFISMDVSKLIQIIFFV